jgi:excisionase family DNA binding protein
MQRGAAEADLLTVPEAAAALKVSPVTVSRWLRQGRLPAYRLGPRAVRIRRADLQAVFAPARPAAAAETAPTVDGAVAATADWSVSATDGSAIEGRLAALAAAAALREQILARRKGAVLPPLESDRKRGKRS